MAIHLWIKDSIAEKKLNENCFTSSVGYTEKNGIGKRSFGILAFVLGGHSALFCHSKLRLEGGGKETDSICLEFRSKICFSENILRISTNQISCSTRIEVFLYIFHQENWDENRHYVLCNYSVHSPVSEKSSKKFV